MKKRSLHKFFAIALMLSFSTTNALGQSTPEKIAGVVAPAAPSAPLVEAQSAPSVYTQFIDATKGKTADDLIRYALSHNGELAAARQMIAEARGRLQQAALKANPMLETSGTQAVTSPDNNLMIGAELPLELGGRRKARVAVAAREIEMRQAEVADFERKLAADVRMKYAEAITLALNLKLTDDLLTLTRNSERLIQARVEHGRSAPLEQNLIAVETSRVETLRISTESKTLTALFDLKKMLGMSPDEALQLRSDFLPQQLPLAQNETLGKALEQRADLVALRAAENLASAQIEQARTEGKVDASIFANYARMSNGYDVRGFDSRGNLAPVTGIFHNATFGIRFTLPVRNKNQGAIEAALANREAARRRREFAEIVVKNEIAAAYARFAHAQAALELYSASVRDQSLRNLEVVRKTYELGQKSVLDYVTEQRRFVEIETGYAEMLKEYLQSLIDIERAAGTTLPAA
ncbi:MAG: TolC family protein [Acidobacteria bacterium]|nr:TolC family protein [Acidobacteriota bacterium]